MAMYPQFQEKIYSVPFLTKQHQEFVLWFYTGSKCNLSCTHCYVESSPTANQHPLLTYETFQKTLKEALSKEYKKLDIYFTGGEPFLNPDLIAMLKTCVNHGDTTVLTNGTRITEEIAHELAEIEKNSEFKLNFRISLDGPNAEKNNLIRGFKAFERATNGLNNLIQNGFNPIVTSMRSWPLLDSDKIEGQFVELLVNQGIPKQEQKLKILPQLRLGREIDRSRPYNSEELFTDSCFTDYDFNQLQCSKCRMVSERGVWVCPILINENEARMGDTLTDAEIPFDLKFMACWTCRMDGMSCTND